MRRDETRCEAIKRKGETVLQSGRHMRRRLRPRDWIVGLAAIAYALTLLALVCDFAPAAHAHAQPQAQSQTFAGLLQPRAAATAQPTNGAFSQPTVGASTPVAPASNASLGSGGLAIATVLGCVTGVLGLLVGSVALIALLRGGYGPFLRTLLPGAKRRAARRNAAASRGGRATARPPNGAYAGAHADRDSREFDGPAPRRTGAPPSRGSGGRRR